MMFIWKDSSLKEFTGFIIVVCIVLAFGQAKPSHAEGVVPLDHDKFLQFSESNLTDTEASALAYYEAVDPNGERTTLEDWKVLNGLDDSVLEDGSGNVRDDVELRSIGIEHALYLNATDLGFVRNIYMREFNGKVVSLLENYTTFEAGKAAFERRDTSGLAAAVVMEYGEVKSGGPKFTQFYGYQNQEDKPQLADGNLQRVEKLDLTGRGKEEYFPGLCASCHGGFPGGVDNAGKFKPHDLAYAGAKDGNFGGGFLPWDPDLYEFNDPDGAGVDVGSGELSRTNQEDNFKELNRLMLLTDPTRAARELVEGWYGGSGLPQGFDSAFVPSGWSDLPRKTFYKNVVAKYCRACHIQRAFPESYSGPNFQETNPFRGLDFRSRTSLFIPQVDKTVFERTTMPMALVTYNKFWRDPVAVQSFVDYIDFYNFHGYVPIARSTTDTDGNVVVVRPGKPVAIPGTYVDQFVGQPLRLDGTASLSASTFMWSVAPSAGATLNDRTSPTPSLTVTAPGVYTVTLRVFRSAVALPENQSDPVSVQIKFVGDPFARVTFESVIKKSPGNARCLSCHIEPHDAGFLSFDKYSEIHSRSELASYAFVGGDFISRLLYKPSGLVADVPVRHGVHRGGKILERGDAYYTLLKDWIEDGECEKEGFIGRMPPRGGVRLPIQLKGCLRLSVTNENTSLKIKPLSPYLNKRLKVSLVPGQQPSHGKLRIVRGNPPFPNRFLDNRMLQYTPDSNYSGMDSYSYRLMDSTSGRVSVVTDKIYVFPDLGLIPTDLTQRFASAFPNAHIPPLSSTYEFEKVNSDGDALPNYLDQFPNDPGRTIKIRRPIGTIDRISKFFSRFGF